MKIILQKYKINFRHITWACFAIESFYPVLVLFREKLDSYPLLHCWVSDKHVFCFPETSTFQEFELLQRLENLQIILGLRLAVLQSFSVYALFIARKFFFVTLNTKIVENRISSQEPSGLESVSVPNRDDK